MLDRRSFILLLSSAGLGTLLAPFLPQASSIIDQSDPLAMRGWTEVMTRVDLEDLVRRYTTLDPVTETMIHPDRLRGRCPFCHTNWDSLLVYCDENLYLCEGCGTDGCVIDFYARIEGVSYREATSCLRALLNAEVISERPVRHAR